MPSEGSLSIDMHYHSHMLTGRGSEHVSTISMLITAWPLHAAWLQQHLWGCQTPGYGRHPYSLHYQHIATLPTDA